MKRTTNSECQFLHETIIDYYPPECLYADDIDWSLATNGGLL